jgi:competence protein ComEC
MLTGSFVLRKQHILQQQKVIVYQINQHAAIDVISGDKSFFLADSALFHDRQALDFNISGNRIFQGIKHVDVQSLFPIKETVIHNSAAHISLIEPGFLAFGKKRIVILSGSFGTYSPAKPFDVEVLILSQNPKQDISVLSSQFNFRELVFDASNSWWNIQKWRSYCDSTGIPYHDVKNQGFYELDL